MKNTKKVLNKGFSLVEMLVVIAVIGIIAAVAVPNIGQINDKAKEATNRRNAQTAASVFSTAQAAGHVFAGTDEATVVDNIIAGTTVTDTQSAFYGEYFGAPSLPTSTATGQDAAARTAMMTYLKFENGQLQYTGSTTN